MGKTAVIAYFALLLAITGTRAVPLFNSTIGTDQRGVDNIPAGVLSNKTAVICRNGTETPCSPLFDSIVGVIQNSTANATKTPVFDTIVGVIQNGTANATKNLFGTPTAANWSCGNTGHVNVSLPANQSGSDAGTFPISQCAEVHPTHVRNANWSTASGKNSTHSFNASGNIGTVVTERNTTLRNDTIGEHILSDEGVPKINETVDGNSSVCPPLVRREGWGGRPPLAVQKLKTTPVPFVVIHHTYIPAACNTSDDCEAKMRSMQDFHMGKGWLNIGYNFIVGGDNRVYIGRGWDVVGAHSPVYNFKSVGISFIGDYRTELPTQEMMELAWNLIRCGVARGSISETYKLVGHRQVRDTECPGDRLYEEIQTWPHWVAHRDIIPRVNTTKSS